MSNIPSSLALAETTLIDKWNSEARRGAPGSKFVGIKVRLVATCAAPPCCYFLRCYLICAHGALVACHALQSLVYNKSVRHNLEPCMVAEAPNITFSHPKAGSVPKSDLMGLWK